MSFRYFGAGQFFRRARLLPPELRARDEPLRTAGDRETEPLELERTEGRDEDRTDGLGADRIAGRLEERIVVRLEGRAVREVEADRLPELTRNDSRTEVPREARVLRRRS